MCIRDSSNTVSVISTSTNTVVKTISVPCYPLGIAITPNGAYAYVTNYKNNTVTIIDTFNNKIVGSPIAVGTEPVDVAITPNGLFAYVSNFANNTVSVINTFINSIVATVSLGIHPSSIEITADGKYAYVTSITENKVVTIDTATNTVYVVPIPVGTGSFGIAISSTLPVIFVSNSCDDTVTVISIKPQCHPIPALPCGCYKTQDWYFNMQCPPKCKCHCKCHCDCKCHKSCKCHKVCKCHENNLIDPCDGVCAKWPCDCCYTEPPANPGYYVEWLYDIDKQYYAQH